MNRSVALLLAICASLLPLRADSPSPTGYVTAVSGVVCQECKVKLTAAVMRLPGVKEVVFARGTQPGVQKVTFASSSDGLKTDDLVKALGESAAEFQILSLDKVKP